MLDDYRRSFDEAYEAVVQTIRQHNQLPTGRAKSRTSIVEKLRRESIRLSQIQDIAGCRIVVANVIEQDRFVASLMTDFSATSVIDRRNKPSYGYRAVHVIPHDLGKPVEIQIRSSLQHLWAELSEKSSDVLDPTIKYGGGPEEWRSILTASSTFVAEIESSGKQSVLAVAYEAFKVSHEEFKKAATERLKDNLSDHEVKKIQGKFEESTRKMERAEQEVQETGGELVYMWDKTADCLKEASSWLDDWKGQKQ